MAQVLHLVQASANARKHEPARIKMKFVKIAAAATMLALASVNANAGWVFFADPDLGDTATNPGPINGAGGTGVNGRPNGNSPEATTAWLIELTGNSGLSVTARNDNFAAGTIGGVMTDGSTLTGLLGGFLVIHYGNGNRLFGNSLVAYDCNVDCGTFTADQARSSWTYYGPRSNVPEPATLALLGLGLAGVGFARRRRA